MKRFFLTLAVFCLITSPAVSQSKRTKQNKEGTASPVLFSVKKSEVSAEEFVYLYKKNHQQDPQDFTREKILSYLDLYIHFKLKVEEARNRKMDTTATFMKEFASYREELRKPYLPDTRLVDSLTRLTYDRMKEEIRAAHILVTIKPDALPEDTLAAYLNISGLRQRAVQGEDFQALAAQFSEDPSARTNHGDLGYFTALQMVYPFENAAYLTPVGSVSNIVRTRFGYHLIKVLDRRQARGEVEVSHIMLRKEGADPKKLEGRIFELYNQLQAGIPWDGICTEHSEDLSSKDKGGRLRAFGVGALSSVPEFEAMAFSLRDPGQISDPFETAFGWHIMRLEKKIPLAPYAALASSLKGRVSRDERIQVSKNALYQKLKSEYGFVEKPGEKEKLFAMADSTLTKGAWNARTYRGDRKAVLFSLGGQPHTLEAFFAFLTKNQRPTGAKPSDYMAQIYAQYVESTLLETFEKRLMESNPDFRMLLREYYEGILLFEIMEKEVWAKGSTDSLAQMAYFQKNQGRYQSEGRARAVIYSSEVKENIAALQSKFEKQDTLEVSAFVRSGKVREERGLFDRGSKLIFSKIPWGKGVFPYENNGMYYLARILEILPPGPKTFKEARPEVISDLQNQIEQSWIGELKRKYPVKVNEKGKAYILSQLQR